MPGPIGIPDLVALPGPSLRLTQRINSPVPPILGLADSTIISVLTPRRPLTLSTIASKTDLPLQLVRRRLFHLERITAVEKHEGGYTRHGSLTPVGRLYALEAKVDDWRKALSQAFRYRAWCDASAAVLLQLPRDTTKPLEQARSLGVGLALGSRWLIPPKIQPLQAERKLQASEFYIAAVKGLQKPPTPLDFQSARATVQD